MNWEKTLGTIALAAITGFIVLDLISSPNTAPIISQLSNGVVSESNLLAGNYAAGYKHNPTA